MIRALYAIYGGLFVWGFLHFVNRHANKYGKVNPEDLFGAAFLSAILPGMYAAALLLLPFFVLLYTTAWLALPAVRRQGSLIACIRSFWS